MTIYKNLDGTTPDKGLSDILRWQIGDRIAGRRRKDPGGFVTPRRENDGEALKETTPHVTWIGHATWVFRLGGKLVATDPIFSNRIQTIRRWTPPGVALENVPPLDVVTISHTHYDHLDLPTLKRIGPNVKYIVPKDCADLLTGAGLPNVVELGWFETHREGDLSITFVPSQHWSMRVPWDRNKRLWGGFVYESHEGVAYHAGDTAFKAEVFEKIAENAPKIDWAMMPIGAYDPQWFMQPQHMGPEEAGRAWEILGARNLLAMHWGTFKLTDEPMGEPKERMLAWWKERGLDERRLWILDVGETRKLVRET